MTTYKALNDLAPTYLYELVKQYAPTRNLISSTSNRVVSISYNLRTYGYRAFSSAVPALWNELPQNVRSCGSLDEFKRLVKTYLFTGRLLIYDNLSNILPAFLFDLIYIFIHFNNIVNFNA